MNALIFYLIKVIICSGLLYGYYWLALSNNRFHQWNRYYLLSATVLSLIMPLLRLPLLGSLETSSEVMHAYTAGVITINSNLSPEKSAGLTENESFVILYAAVAFILLIITAVTVLKIIRLARKNPKKHFNHLLIVLLTGKISPFSFFKYIFWNNQLDPESVEGQQIFRHELVHVNEKHSVDKLFMEIICALYWINPFFHVMRRELSVIHEFIADKKAAEKDDYSRYAKNLLKQVLLNTPYTITNNFFHKQIKRRITMLINSKKNRYAYLRRIMAIPITIMVCYTIAIGRDINKVSLKDIPVNKQINTLVGDTNSAPKVVVTAYPSSRRDTTQNKIFSQVEQPPTFPGGEDELLKYLHDHIRYPAEARDNGIQGAVMVSFVVRKDGNISQVKTVNQRHGDGLEEEGMRVVEDMPKWNPGKQNGQKVNVLYKVPIRFQLQSSTGADTTPPPPPPPAPPATSKASPSTPPAPAPKNGEKVFKFVEQPPTFPGGEDAVMKFLHDHIHYPTVARDNGIQGTVTVTFIVKKNGDLTNVKAIGTPKGGGLDEEAIRVVKIMPKWNPGKQNGKPVNVQFNLPVKFQLQ